MSKNKVKKLERGRASFAAINNHNPDHKWPVDSIASAKKLRNLVSPEKELKDIKRKSCSQLKMTAYQREYAIELLTMEILFRNYPFSYSVRKNMYT